MPVTVVVGTQWGDEGKAKIIDLLAGAHSHVVRYQGGHNAGHTVVVGSERYALQLVPSGVLYPHVTPVIGNGVVVDLPTLFNEIDTLERRGVACAGLRVSTLAHLIFPWHQRHDAISESSRGESKLGTTLKGIGPAYSDKVKRIGVRAGDVRDRDRFRTLVKERATQKTNSLRRSAKNYLTLTTSFVVTTTTQSDSCRTLPTPSTCCTTRSTTVLQFCSKARKQLSSTSTTARIRT